MLLYTVKNGIVMVTPKRVIFRQFGLKITPVELPQPFLELPQLLTF